MDLSSFDFRTGKMLMSKLNRNRQRLHYDPAQSKVKTDWIMSCVLCIVLFVMFVSGCLFQGKPDLNTSLPVRQTASIFKQPVTKVTNHPSNKVKMDPQKAVDQPRQVNLTRGAAVYKE